MAFMSARGVDLPNPHSFRGIHDVAGLKRLMTGQVIGDQTLRDLWSWSGTIGPIDSEKRGYWKHFLHGAGETWMFADGDDVGSRASVPNGGGSYTISGSGGRFNGRVTVSSGSYIELPSLIVPADGWSIRFHRDQGSGYEHVVVWGTGTTISAQSVSIDGAAATTAVAAGVDHYLAVASDGDVRLLGVDDTGSNTAVDYSEVEIRAYTIDEDIGTGMSGVTQECYPLPYHALTGTGVDPDSLGAQRRIKARIAVSSSDPFHSGGDMKGLIGLDVRESR